MQGPPSHNTAPLNWTRGAESSQESSSNPTERDEHILRFPDRDRTAVESPRELGVLCEGWGRGRTVAGRCCSPCYPSLRPLTRASCVPRPCREGRKLHILLR